MSSNFRRDNAIGPHDSRCCSPVTTEQFLIAQSMKDLIGDLAQDEDYLQVSENVRDNNNSIENPHMAAQTTFQEEKENPQIQSLNKLKDEPITQYVTNTKLNTRGIFPLSNVSSIEQDMNISFLDSPGNLPMFSHSTPMSILNNIIEIDFEEQTNNESRINNYVESENDFDSDDSVADPNYILPEATAPLLIPSQTIISEDEPNSPSVLNESNNSPEVVYKIVAEMDEEKQLVKHTRHEKEINDVTGPSLTPNQSNKSKDESNSPPAINENTDSLEVVYQIGTEMDEEEHLVEQTSQVMELNENTEPLFTHSQFMTSEDKPNSPSVLNENNDSPETVYQIVTEVNEKNQSLDQTRQEIEIAQDKETVEDIRIDETRKRRKRKQPDTWKKNITKKLRNTGQEYITYKGKVAEKKSVKSIDTECCNLHCGNAIDDDGKIKIFTAFWNFGDLSKQRDFISKNVTRTKSESSRVQNSRRKYTQIYTLMHNNSRIAVCKKIFMNTLNVSEKMIRTALYKAERGICEIQSPDKRGRHVPSNKDPDKTAFAIRHIELFPAVPSHWCRKDTKKLYLEANLNREKMYELYKTYCEQNDQIPICKTSYKELLIAKNVEFYKPRKDQCWCYRFQTLPAEEQIGRQEEYDLHIRRKNEAREAKRNDTNIAKCNNEVMCVNFDLEAVLYSPLFYAKPLFYKRKLATFNFTIYDPSKKQGYCYVWPEYEGNRGANEVATCLRDFINSIEPEVKHLIMYSDCCPGQNRNSILAIMLSAAISEVEYIKTIDYKFLESGHTYMECDSMHATIERASETAKINIPQDWFNVIKLAKKQNPYKLKEMEHSDFIDFKKMRGSIVSTLKATDGTVLQWSKVKWLRFEKNTQDVLYFKYEYHEEEFKKVFLQLKRTNTRFNPSNCDGPPKAYSEKLPINSAKYRDLIDLCSTNIIPTCYHDFYKGIPKKIATPNSEHQQSIDGGQEEDDLSLAAVRATYARRRPNRRN